MRWSGIIGVVIVASVALVVGAIFFPDRAVKVSAAGFEVSPPDVAKCQIQAKLLADSMAAVTETIKALTTQTSGEASAVALLRAQYLKDNIYEDTGHIIYGGPRHSDFLQKTVEELGADRSARDALLKQQGDLLARTQDLRCDTR